MFCKRAQQQPRNMFLLLCIVFYWHTFSNGPHKVAILDRTPVCATPPLQATWHHEEKRAQTDLVCLCACLICLSTRNTATCFTNASGNMLRRATPTPACVHSLAHSLSPSQHQPVPFPFMPPCTLTLLLLYFCCCCCCLPQLTMNAAIFRFRFHFAAWTLCCHMHARWGAAERRAC